jgi:flavin-dependent dehydrogenase
MVRDVEDAPDGSIVRTNGESVRARYVLDASGLTGLQLLPVDPISPADLCAAAQGVFDVVDRRAALEFFEQHRATPGETLAFVGLSGGYSVINVRLRDDCVAILTGSISALGFRSGAQMLDEFVANRPWIGARRFGGSRAIPLVLPRKPFASRTRALLGDAAGQVFPAHGSGISAGMAAGRMCAEAIERHGDLRRYERSWRKRFELLFRSYDMLRRVSQTLTVDETERLMTSGLFDEASLRAGLEQRPLPLGIDAMFRSVVALRRVPWIVPRVARALRGA